MQEILQKKLRNTIKFLNLNKQDKNIQRNIFKDFKNIINRSNFINGNEVRIFEDNLQIYR